MDSIEQLKQKLDELRNKWHSSIGSDKKVIWYEMGLINQKIRLRQR
jgi:hypothetical protein